MSRFVARTAICHHRYNERNLSQNFTPASAITKASFIKVKISDFQNRFNDEYAHAFPTSARQAVKVENRSRLTFFVHWAEADSLSS